MRQSAARARDRRSRLLRRLSVSLIVVAISAVVAVPVALAGGSGGGSLATAAASPAPVPPPHVISAGAAGKVFRGRGMWIWMMSSSNGGNLSSIIRQARAYGLSTVFIKSGDGTGMWSQFNPSVVSALRRAHLHVCAWQYVYGVHPYYEAQVGARAVRDGANCLVIDAEVEYQGRYVQAQTYIRTLRKLIGPRVAVALAGFPYIDYHLGFPYSVFLGPGGAQVNVPQMYWRDIGTTVDGVYAHTYDWNELYQRPIAPLGQLYNSPPLRQVRRFRAIARSYGATGLSWWDWQSSNLAQWGAAAQPVGRIRGYVAQRTVVSLSQGAAGDVVVWAQEHLVSAGDRLTIDGSFGPNTAAAVHAFQSAHQLPATGVIDPRTWLALLRYRPAHVTWVMRNHRPTATVSRGGSLVLPVPRSASTPQRRNELAGAPGRGRPSGKS